MLASKFKDSEGCIMSLCPKRTKRKRKKGMKAKKEGRERLLAYNTQRFSLSV